MEQELVLGAAATFGGVIGGWLFLKPLKEPLPPMSPKAKTGFYYAGVFLIGLGLINLLYGFLDNELFVSGRYGGYVGWLNYDAAVLALARHMIDSLALVNVSLDVALGRRRAFIIQFALVLACQRAENFLEPATPSRLLSAFPAEAPVRRCGLAETVAEIREFLGEAR